MKLRSLALGSVASVALFASGALAADLPVRGPAPAPVIVAPIFTWTGFYVGVNAGYGGDKFTASDSWYNEFEGSTSDLYRQGQSINSSGFLGGLQIGYNWQFAGGFVLGVEADYQWSNIEGSHTWNNTYPGGYAEREKIGGEVTSFGTVRARLGYAAFANRALFYVTGGWAYGRTKFSYSYSDTDGYTDGYSRRFSPNGWTVGAGLEYALTNNVTFKTEYLFVDLGSKSQGYSYDNGKGGFVVGRASVDNKFHVVRAGLNYKFGWGSAAAPVVARY